MKPMDHMAKYGITKEIFKRLKKSQQSVLKNSWRILKVKNAMNRKQLDKDLQELVTIFYDEDFNVIYNEKDVLKNTKFAKRARG